MTSNPRPAKRQRRSTIVLADDDGEPEVTGLPLRRLTSKPADSATTSKNGTRSKTSLNVTRKSISRTSSARSSPKSSPEKSRKSKKLSIDGAKTKSLHNFFNRASSQERWHKRSATPDDKNTDAFNDDIVDDESMDEALQEAMRMSRQDQVKEENSTSTAVTPLSASQLSGPATSSQRFRKPGLPQKLVPYDHPKEHEVEADSKPWAEKYSPTSLEELAVHKKKAQDVHKWIDDALSGHGRQRILVLKGPAGSGKSTTVQLIARARKCELVAWQNPDTPESGALSSSLQFAEFVTRGGDYGALSMTGSAASQDTSPGSRLLLVEEFPATMTKNSNALESFRSVLLNATAAVVPTSAFARTASLSGPPPIILVISETLISSSTAFTDSFTAQRLLGSELVNHPAVCVIDFNPVAPTILSKAIDTVIRKEARDTKRRRIPGPAVLQKLAGMGDVRNAINALQFLCARGDGDGEWSGTVAANAKRGSRTNQPLSSMEENSVKLISSRETTLDMFHAAGKVCYNKRVDPSITGSRSEPSLKPSDHLNHIHRPKVSEVNIEDLLNETGTDIQTFVSVVHQNYILSCNHDDFVDYFDGCATVLSDAVSLDPDSRASASAGARASATQTSILLGTSDTLRQDEISFQVATRGVLFNLPFPVSRTSPPGASRAAAFKMYYPASLRLWRSTEETNGLLEHVSAMMLGQTAGRKGTEDPVETVTSWKHRATAFETGPADVDDRETHDITRTDFSKDALVLDVLPYMTRIKSGQGEDTTMLRKITQLRGFNVVTEEEPDEEPLTEETSGAVRLSQKIAAAHEKLQARRVHRFENKQSLEEPAIEKLWIEDDDIQDD